MRLNSVMLLLALVLAPSASSWAQKVSFAEVADHALSESQLTLPGSVPFHLKAEISEKDSPDSDYKANIEVYWLSPTKWRRSIRSDEFTQTLITNSDKTYEHDDGDYFPLWVREFVTALTNPLPMLQTLKAANADIRKPSGGEQSIDCARLQSKIGVPPAENTAFYVVCFGGNGLLQSVVTPGYGMEFKDYKSFTNKKIPRLLVTDPEPGTTIEGKTVELTELRNPDEDLFTIPNDSVNAQRLQSLVVSEATLRGLSLQAPEIIWPAVRSGKTTGVLSMYVSIDDRGHVRETFPLDSDNAGLDDAVRQQVMKWQFKQAVSNGVSVQLESTLTFAFSTKVDNPIPLLTDEEARHLATNTVELAFPPGTPSGTSVTIRASIGLNGKLLGVGNPNNAPTALFLAAYSALTKWHFQPYIKDGKPDLYNADITFTVH